jgi:hypothetical protein
MQHSNAVRAACFAIAASFATVSYSDMAILPNGYSLVKSTQGGYSVNNVQNAGVVGPGIVSIGFNERYIVACEDRKVPVADQKRMVFIRLDNGVAVDTINSRNWAYFVSHTPELKQIKLRHLTSTSCP